MTAEREKRLSVVLQKRQFDITVVLENVWDPHNVSAVLRSCDAVGIQEVYIISPKDKKESKLGKKSSASASKWLTIHHFKEVTSCFEILRKKYAKIYSTRLSQDAENLYAMDFTQSLALVFGNEKDGVSQEAAVLSDGNFQIPQTGMIQSLNISVACAVTLYECYRQRSFARMYDSTVENPERQALFQQWKSR
ncbi:MAG: RNA methyltransferase [Chitinophagaceae bacterium]|nr:RNA methyltransferase [Chitinophagaceae bacterium]